MEQNKKIWRLTIIVVLLFCFIVVVGVFLNRQPKDEPTPITYTIEVHDDIAQITTFLGKTYCTDLECILSELQDSGSLQYITQINNSGTSLVAIDGITANSEADTGKWGIKINWADSVYSIENIPIHDNDVIWLVYEKDQW